MKPQTRKKAKAMRNSPDKNSRTQTESPSETERKHGPRQHHGNDEALRCFLCGARLMELVTKSGTWFACGECDQQTLDAFGGFSPSGALLNEPPSQAPQEPTTSPTPENQAQAQKGGEPRHIDPTPSPANRSSNGPLDPVSPVDHPADLGDTSPPGSAPTGPAKPCPECNASPGTHLLTCGRGFAEMMGWMCTRCELPKTFCTTCQIHWCDECAEEPCECVAYERAEAQATDAAIDERLGK